MNIFPQLLQCDGNLYDAMSIAIKAALFNTKYALIWLEWILLLSSIWQLFLWQFCWQNPQSFHILWWRRRKRNRAVGWPVWLHEAQCGECPLYSDAVQSKPCFFVTPVVTHTGNTHTYEPSCFSVGGPPPHRWCHSAGEGVLCGEPHHVSHTQGHGHLHT